MTLAALIAAYHESSEPGGMPRAALPLAGRTLLERQARLAASAGATPVIILVERLHPQMTAAIDRLRSEGIAVTVARTVADAADAVHSTERLLIMADGLVADESHIARLISVEGPVLLTIPDHAADDRFERIDAHSRWAGLAMVDGEMLKRTAAALHDWDLQSTLLRRAVQSGARQFSVRGEPADDRLLVAESIADLEEAEFQIVEEASAAREDWVSRYLLAPVEQLATRLLMPGAVGPHWVHILDATLIGLAAFLFTRDWLWPGAILLLLATPLDGIADRLAALRLQPTRSGFWRRWVVPGLGAAALLALSLLLSQTRGWGCLALAASTIAFFVALWEELKGQDLPGRVFLAERKGMTWLMLPFAVTGFWTTGLAALAAYAAGSFFWAQRRRHRLLPEVRQD